MKKIQKQWSILCASLAILVLMTGFIPVLAYDEPQVSIAEIQGDSWSTPYAYDYVETWGIVTADYQWESKRGFFLQDPIGDGNPATSEGIFVYERYNFDVDVGDEIRIVARVSEYYGFTELSYVQDVEILSTGNDLPAPVELNPPFDDYESDVYYEALEGMLVSVKKLRVIAGTDTYGEFAGVVHNLGIHRVFESDEDKGMIIFGDEAGGCFVNVKSGYLVKNLVGPLDYTYDEYKILPSADNPPKVCPDWFYDDYLGWGSMMRGLTVATYNMFNLFEDDNLEIALAKHALTIHDYLREPDLIAVQEVEKIELLEQLAETAPIETNYGAILIEGYDARGIDVGLLYNMDKVNIISAYINQTTTDLDDGYGPGDNMLFSRPPLVIHLELLWKGKAYTDMWVIVNHFKSKSIYAPYYADTTPRRIEQAEWVSYLVDEIQEDDPKAYVMVLGDLNDFEYSEPLQVLIDGGLKDLIFKVHKRTRYTYIYRGYSQVLDHILITPSLARLFQKIRIVHSNVDWPYPLFGEDTTTGIRSSDHDILLASFRIFPYKMKWRWWFC
ncbi:MAG: endonuclease/exonuclease/phosphatase family protein [Candidatus Thorarchaeota archaeon]